MDSATQHPGHAYCSSCTFKVKRRIAKRDQSRWKHTEDGWLCGYCVAFGPEGTY